MKLQEFSDEFDVKLRSYLYPRTFGQSQKSQEFDEYEKSVFLTRAQEQVVINLYDGKLTGASFEMNEEIRSYLNALITECTPVKQSDKGISPKSVVYSIPKTDVLFRIYESAEVQTGNECCPLKQLEVVPVTHDEYHKIKGNPFRNQNSRRVLRLDSPGSKVELISNYPISNYKLRYIRRPKPIILIDLPKGLEINNSNTKTECELNPALHKTILDLAVSLAASSISSAD